jgi:hypothetical protein
MKVAEISSRVAIVTLPSTRAVGHQTSCVDRAEQSFKGRLPFRHPAFNADRVETRRWPESGRPMPNTSALIAFRKSIQFALLAEN